jgi:hypothetical protein
MVEFVKRCIHFLIVSQALIIWIASMLTKTEWRIGLRILAACLMDFA